MIRIMLAEDDPAQALLTEMALNEVAPAHERVEIARFATGHDALAAVSGPPPDLALLDIRLPGASGFDVLAAIRAAPGWSEVPVVMLSMADDERDRQRAASLGANDYMVKPLGLDALEALLRGVLARWVIRS
ncbi:MAG: response regulator [Chloroflexota bacterium]|nr:response regulator [Dehalococcoidia bacterium]MDW8254922.1 response regulator [Chloroflexota bacterium]